MLSTLECAAVKKTRSVKNHLRVHLGVFGVLPFTGDRVKGFLFTFILFVDFTLRALLQRHT